MEKTDEELRLVIEEGAEKMPGYKKEGKLTDQQITDVLIYYRSLVADVEPAESE